MRPPARTPAHAARRARRPARVRRARTVTVLGAVVVLGVVLAQCTSGSRTTRTRAASTAGRVTTAALAAAESGLEPWSLHAPLSRMAVVPGQGSQLVILGGLTAGGSSASGVYTLDTGGGAAGGTLAHVGDLPSGVHDGAGAVVGGTDVVLGGGSPQTVAAVQGLPAPGEPAGAAGSTGSAPPGSPPGAIAPGGVARGSVLGQLPQPRSDAAAVQVAGVTYLVGGYDGTNPDPSVLATTNGTTYTSVGNLPVPVRYPAVAALGQTIYVFGGQAITGPDAGAPLDTVQVVDTATHRVAEARWHLPEPLSGAQAATIGGEIFLFGGESTAPQQSTPGVGTTQLDVGNRTIGGPVAGSGPSQPAPAAGPAEGSPATGGTTAPTTTTVGTIWAIDPAAGQALVAGRLQVPVSHAGVAVLGATAWIVGGENDGTVLSTVQMVTPNQAFGTAGAPGAGSPYFGSKLLIADRGNNRLILMDPAMNVLWTYPAPGAPPNPLGFYFPDDAFFIDHGKAIISNQEENETIVEIAYPSGQIIWSYGHAKQTGTAPGYLHEPDDAYLLRNGQISVADAQNCRVLVLDQNGTVAQQIGKNGVCVHDPQAGTIGSPNGDTPLWNGDLLVSEINGSWVSEFTLQGQLVWTVHLPIAYPSDPQQLGASPTNNNDRYLIADYADPGEILEFTREGQVLSTYDVTSGPGMLNHPSLAEKLPSGVYLINDDYRHRMVAIDPTTGALVWQYGITDHAGTAPGMLNTPDGFDLLNPDGTTPTHPQTG